MRPFVCSTGETKLSLNEHSVSEQYRCYLKTLKFSPHLKMLVSIQWATNPIIVVLQNRTGHTSY